MRLEGVGIAKGAGAGKGRGPRAKNGSFLECGFARTAHY